MLCNRSASFTASTRRSVFSSIAATDSTEPDDAADDGHDLAAERCEQSVWRTAGVGRHVVEEARTHGRGVHAQASQDPRDSHAVRDVGIVAAPPLIAMPVRGDYIGLANQLPLGAGVGETREFRRKR